MSQWRGPKKFRVQKWGITNLFIFYVVTQGHMKNAQQKWSQTHLNKKKLINSWTLLMQTFFSSPIFFMKINLFSSWKLKVANRLILKYCWNSIIFVWKWDRQFLKQTNMLAWMNILECCCMNIWTKSEIIFVNT